MVEDHPLNAEIAMRLLQKAGCEVDWTKNGKEGVDAFEKSAINEYDVILMDVRMPVMDGFEAARCIRALEREDSKDVPIVAMTANAYEEDVAACLKAGMNDHLSKPVDVNKMYQTLAFDIPLECIPFFL